MVGKTQSFDFVRDVESWKYCNVEFEDDTKDENHSSKVATEMLYTGVWFLQHKNALDEADINELGLETTSEVFVVNIPQKYHNDPEIIEAKERELEKWQKYDAYEEVESNDRHILGSRWVVQEKNGKIKARFVVKGCQEQLDPRSDSPTASRDSFKLFLSLAANEDFHLKSLDVTSAFLQGRPLDRDIFINPPPERASPGQVWKLKKSCYGLYDASRQWFMAVKETLLTMNMKSLSGDDAFFFCIRAGKLIGMVILHVDDFLVAGTTEFFQIVKKKLIGRFTFGKIEFGSFKFTGLNIKQTSEGILVDQNDYVQSLEPIKLEKVADKYEKLSKKKFTEFRGLIGQLSWAAENTRPDIAFDTRELSTKNKEATYGDLKDINKVLKKAQLEKDVTLKFSKLGNIDDLKIIAFTDSSYRNSENKEKSVGGRFMCIANNSGKCSPLAWKSKTIQQVCKSVKTAETRSLEKGLEDAIYIARMIKEIYSGNVTEDQIEVEAKIDSKTLLDSLNSSKQVDEKGIRHLIAWIKQQMEMKTVAKINWVCSSEQAADVFTKKNVNTDHILSVVTQGKLLM